ncbi:hypothetical protein [Burkholderia sp. MBR-1]|uniref:hypothetical protein n=1 Tax=Burkholderia sp. MBR-1 TaxID=2732364 RepID=UPI0015EF8254|nr:hypothetical protein [Burkholderia sp. MBR-1]QMI49928.1 hypothetical protein MBR110_31210 [Burkholderia sp. MBR-1]
MPLFEGWIIETAILGHTPSIGDLALWAFAEGDSDGSSGSRDLAATKPLERKRTLSVSIDGKGFVLRGDLDRLPEPGETVRMLAMRYARLDSTRPEYGGTRWYSIECVGETYRAIPN